MGILISLLMSQNTDLSILMTQCTYITKMVVLQSLAYIGETNNFRVTLLQLLSYCAKSIFMILFIRQIGHHETVFRIDFNVTQLSSVSNKNFSWRAKRRKQVFERTDKKKFFLNIVKQTGSDEKSFERDQTWLEPIAVESETLSLGMGWARQTFKKWGCLFDVTVATWPGVVGTIPAASSCFLHELAIIFWSSVQRQYS